MKIKKKEDETMTITYDLSKFGNMELDIAQDILQQMIEGNTPEKFDYNGIKLFFDDNEPLVFIENECGQKCKMDYSKGKLVLF